VAAVRTLFGNPVALLAVTVPLTLWRFRLRTTD
jgi:hypothetical protein